MCVSSVLMNAARSEATMIPLRPTGISSSIMEGYDSSASASTGK